MNEVFDTLGRWLLRALLLAVGLVIFLSLLTVAALVAVLWGVRLLWAKLTGKPVVPLTAFRIDPRQGFAWAASRTARYGGPVQRPQEETPSARAARLPGANQEVTDVQPRQPQL